MVESITKVIEFLPPLIKALPLTLLLTAVAGVIGLVLGTLAALARLSKSKLLSTPAFVFTFAFRGTPLLVQLYLIYYGLGQILPGTWVRHSFLWPYMRDGLWYAIFALSLNQGAYNAEVIRGAIKSIARGQIEAALSIGMSPYKVLRRITLPLAFRHCMPVLTSDLIILLKSTSLASTITIMEVMGTARALQRSSLLIFEPLIAAGIIYFTVVFILTRIMNGVERRVSGHSAAMI
ncbi:ABC transporter permease subunit [Brucella pseudogrignonensis]|uniref:Polar amino acid transport system permease protein/octopine/nopaline transport system permease protein n=1 Tax=Brucella pseudogrignonensis TaxID=419475 RepID=A0ABU1M8R2_9HYPH|nr:ABC transporter permease subunit [Brucella pseudogrignonensis]MDR6432420.1 polar amino acid transport system permease protein/octopine/nopaline transport system permease protein [Brucella pseudogrignonensis]